MERKYTIYKIICKNSEIKHAYVGQTTCFKKRKYAHSYSCNNPESAKGCLQVYEIIRRNGGWSNWEIIPIEEYTCKTRENVRERELYWVNELKADMNSIIPYSPCAYSNPIERNMNYKCECGGKYTFQNKRKHENTKKHIIFTFRECLAEFMQYLVNHKLSILFASPRGQTKYRRADAVYNQTK